jgi:hypothetical protein
MPDSPLDRPASARNIKLMTIYITAIAKPLVRKGLLNRDDIFRELSELTPISDKALREDIKAMIALIGAW